MSERLFADLGEAVVNIDKLSPHSWSLYLLFFIFTAFLGGSIAFLCGRIVVISAHNVRQRVQDQVVIGDLSPDDLSGAITHVTALQQFIQTWTISPFAANAYRPPPVALRYEQDTIYFAETYHALLWSGGKGPGTYQFNETQTLSLGGASVGTKDNEGAFLRCVPASFHPA